MQGDCEKVYTKLSEIDELWDRLESIPEVCGT
jgi:hypothetical protein